MSNQPACSLMNLWNVTNPASVSTWRLSDFNTTDVYPSMNRRRNCDLLSKFCQIFVKTKRDVVAHFHAVIMEVYLSFNLSETQFQNTKFKHLFCTCLNTKLRSPICGTVWLINCQSFSHSTFELSLETSSHFFNYACFVNLNFFLDKALPTYLLWKHKWIINPNSHFREQGQRIFSISKRLVT